MPVKKGKKKGKGLLSFIPGVGPILDMIVGGKKAVRRPPRRKAKRGDGVWDVLKSGYNLVKKHAPRVHQLAKDHKVASRLLDTIGEKGLAELARKYGYGKRRAIKI